MDLTFKAREDDFTGVWPARMHIENPEYVATLFYAGATADPASDVGEYAADRAAGRLARKNLLLSCKPKSPKRGTNLSIMGGHVVLRPMPTGPLLTVSEARRFAEDLMAAIGSATALDDFITARFGPAVWPDDG